MCFGERYFTNFLIPQGHDTPKVVHIFFVMFQNKLFAVTDGVAKSPGSKFKFWLPKVFMGSSRKIFPSTLRPNFGRLALTIAARNNFFSPNRGAGPSEVTEPI